MTPEERTAQLRAAGVFLHRKGDGIAYVSRQPLTQAQVVLIRSNRTAMLDYLLLHPGLPSLCYWMAEARGFPPMQTAAGLVGYGSGPWKEFALSVAEPALCDAMLRLGDVPVEGMEAAA